MLSERPPNAGGSPESRLEARLRALPTDPVPVGLEARLLGAIPARIRTPRRRAGVWLGLIGAAAAAAILALLAWREPDGPQGDPGGLSSQPATSKASAASPKIAARDPVPGAPAGFDPTTFTWPVREAHPLTVLSAIPADL